MKKLITLIIALILLSACRQPQQAAKSLPVAKSDTVVIDTASFLSNNGQIPESNRKETPNLK